MVAATCRSGALADAQAHCAARILDRRLTPLRQVACCSAAEHASDDPADCARTSRLGRALLREVVRERLGQDRQRGRAAAGRH